MIRTLRTSLAVLIGGVFICFPFALSSAMQQGSTPAATQPPGPPLKPAPEPQPVPPVDPPPIGRALETRLNALVHGTLARAAASGIKVVEVETGQVVAERNPSRPLIPASNMKLFTTAAAFELLPDDFKFVTTVAVRGEIEADGLLRGDLKVTGRGDPTIGGRFHDGNANAVFAEWASQLQAEGISAIGGDLIFEHGYFDQVWVHPTWSPSGNVHWYQAPVAALSLQEGTVRVRVTPTAVGQRANVELFPRNRFVTLQHTAVTGPGPGVFITRTLGTNNIIVRGNAPPRGATDVFIAIQDPVHYFASVVRTSFENYGILIQGRVRLIPQDETTGWRPLIVQTTPLEIATFVVNKKSQNQYAEQLLKTLGAEIRDDGSFGSGGAVVADWVTSLGVPVEQIHVADGSGMSRQNRASADAFIHTLQHMWNSPHRNDFVASMPYTGEQDSRLRRRVHEPGFARQVYAKTGYISGAIGLSGYVRGRSGRVYAFSFIFNAYPGGVGPVYRLQDDMLREIIRHG